MSHFTVLVIGDNIEDQLEKYDENIEMPIYDDGEVSGDELERFKEYYKKEKQTTEDDINKLYLMYGDDWNNNRWKLHSDGTFHYWSTYNPDSKWDWYVIGGRWSGEVLKLKETATSGVIGQSGSFGNNTGIDQALIKDIDNLNEISVFAVVKDGVWYEKGEMGWWGMVRNEISEKEWDDKISELLNNLPEDTLITVVDCHI